MKRIFIIISFAVLSTTGIATQNVPAEKTVDNIEQANQMYKQGQYTDAAKLYEQALKQGEAAALYYNLGNSYFKSEEIGRAILNYERALRLDPALSDAKYNLAIAESKIVDNVNSSPTFFVRRWINSLIESFTSNQWAVISFVIFMVVLAGFFIFAFSHTRNRRKISFYLTAVLFALFIITFSFSGIRKEHFLKHNDAVVMSGAVAAKSSPDKSGTDLFQLHEGTRVRVKSTLGNWSEITLENGAVGWVEESAIARI